ncbi:MAG: flagellar basal body P-ring formation chaperone FlgA [Bryobacteraceae bacterium]
MRMPWLAILLGLSVAIAQAATPGAAKCVAVAGDRILALHLAQANAAFSALAPDLEIGFAPAPGLVRKFSARELTHLAATHDISLAPGASACFERERAQLTREQVMEALRRALEAAPDGTAVRIELLDFSRFSTPPGELRFPLSGIPKLPGSAPRPAVWRGRLQYGEKQSLPVWARVRLTASVRRVVAAQPLRAGQPVQASQIRLEDAEVFPVLETAAGSAPIVSIEEAVGRVPRSSIRAGDWLRRMSLESPQQVGRGDKVTVIAASGAARLQFEATALSAGSDGESVLVRNPDNGRSFRAQVVGKGKVSVLPVEDMGSEKR